MFGGSGLTAQSAAETGGSGFSNYSRIHDLGDVSLPAEDDAVSVFGADEVVEVGGVVTDVELNPIDRSGEVVVLGG